MKEKRGTELGLGRRSSFGVAPSHFLLLRDQTTWKRRFEEAKVRGIIFYDFDFGVKALT